MEDHVTGPRPPAEESPEVDPTGMRALLSSLPEPGPMPADLVARITAALEQEAAAGTRVGAATSSTVVPLRGRPAWRTAVIAAASAAAVLVLGVPLATGWDPGELSAIFGRGSSSSGASGADSGQEKNLPQLAQGSDAASDGGVIVRMTGTAYTSTRLAVQARALLATTSSPAGPAASPTDGPIALAGTPSRVRGCAEALGVAPQEPIAADLATYDGTQAWVLVVGRGAGATAYVVDRTCTTTAPRLMAGPLRLHP